MCPRTSEVLFSTLPFGLWLEWIWEDSPLFVPLLPLSSTYIISPNRVTFWVVRTPVGIWFLKSCLCSRPTPQKHPLLAHCISYIKRLEVSGWAILCRGVPWLLPLVFDLAYVKDDSMYIKLLVYIMCTKPIMRADFFLRLMVSFCFRLGEKM